MNIQNTNLLSVPLADAPALPGLRFRRFRDENDFALMTAVLNAANAADGIDEYFGPEEVAVDTEAGDQFDRARDLLLAEVDGAVVGYGRVNWWPEDRTGLVFSLQGSVHPGWRGKGLGRAIFQHTESRAIELAREKTSGAPAHLQAFAHDVQPGAVALLQKAGYAAVRHTYAMARPHLDDLPEALLPDGLLVRPIQPEDFRAIWEAREEAFRDHWGHRQATDEKYREWLNMPFFNPNYWQVAWDGDQVAGMVLTFVIEEENEHFGRQRGYTESIAVRRPWRKRGLATALLVRSLRHLKELGFTEARLFVDTQNESGALRLYERVGFRQVRRETAYRKQLSVNSGR